MHLKIHVGLHRLEHLNMPNKDLICLEMVFSLRKYGELFHIHFISLWNGQLKGHEAEAFAQKMKYFQKDIPELLIFWNQA